MTTPWRLFLDGEHSGARNMAVDEAMLLAHARGLAPATLRFYGWNPHCLSLGRLQQQLPEGVSPHADFDVVRRPTGGRAVWHAQEITYCAVVRAELLPVGARSVAGAYAHLNAGFLSGLRDLGLPVAMAPGGVRTNGANCFSASAGCDFTANGKKLIGAAQFRRDETILQHGSLLLAIDEGWKHAGGPMDDATSLELLGATAPSNDIIAALCAGFAGHAGVEWERGGLGGAETELAQLLFEQKYRAPEWTFGARLAGELEVSVARIVENWKRGQSREVKGALPATFQNRACKL